MKINITYNSEQANTDITIILNPAVKKESRERHKEIGQEISRMLEEQI